MRRKPGGLRFSSPLVSNRGFLVWQGGAVRRLRACCEEGRIRVLIIFYVAFCMEPAQAKHNEALGMRVTSHEPSVFRAEPDPATLPPPSRSAGTSLLRK